MSPISTPQFWHGLFRVGAGDVDGSFVPAAGVGGEPLLAAGEEVVEFGLAHLLGEIGVAAEGHDAAEGVAFFDGDFLLRGIELDDGVPGIAGRIPVGVDEGGEGAEGALEVGDVGHEEQLVGVGLQEDKAADFHLVFDLLIDVVGDEVGKFLLFFPEPGELLAERAAFGFFGAGPVKIAFDDHIGLDLPTGSGADEFDGEIGQQIEAKTVGSADGWAVFRPAFARWPLDVDILAGWGIEEVLAEFEIVEHVSGVYWRGVVAANLMVSGKAKLSYNLGSLNEATRLLNAINNGEAWAAEELLPLVYQELRRLGRSGCAGAPDRRWMRQAPGS